jgi:hypothetical protein
LQRKVQATKITKKDDIKPSVSIQANEDEVVCPGGERTRYDFIYLEFYYFLQINAPLIRLAVRWSDETSGTNVEIWVQVPIPIMGVVQKRMLFVALTTNIVVLMERRVISNKRLALVFFK